MTTYAIMRELEGRPDQWTWIQDYPTQEDAEQEAYELAAAFEHETYAVFDEDGVIVYQPAQ